MQNNVDFSNVFHIFKFLMNIWSFHAKVVESEGQYEKRQNFASLEGEGGGNTRSTRTSPL